MKNKAIRSIFWAIIAVFAIIIVTLLVGARLVGNSLFFSVIIPAGVIFLGLGVAMLVLTIKTKVAGKQKIFLLLTGASVAGIPVFVILHNLVYALFIIWFGDNFWGAEGDEPVFFILATMICPLGFLVGAIGTIVIARKNKPSLPAATP
jgi:hypothetical protein